VIRASIAVMHRFRASDGCVVTAVMFRFRGAESTVRTQLETPVQVQPAGSSV